MRSDGGSSHNNDSEEEMPDDSDDDGYNEYSWYNGGYYYRDGRYKRKVSPMMSLQVYFFRTTWVAIIRHWFMRIAEYSMRNSKS